MGAQPRLQGVGGAVGQHVDPPAGLGVDQHGRVAATARSAKSSTPSTRGTVIAGSGIRSSDAQRRVPRSGTATPEQPRPGPAG